MGFTTAFGGGIIKDLLVLKTPMVLSEDSYAAYSITGALWLYLSSLLHYGINFAMYSSFFVVLILRVTVLIFGWRLPKFKKS